MFESVNRNQVRQLVDEGAQVIEVLEDRQYKWLTCRELCTSQLGN